MIRRLIYDIGWLLQHYMWQLDYFCAYAMFRRIDKKFDDNRTHALLQHLSL